MVNDGKITLTLGELKEYFKIWHENNFNELHTQKIKNTISEYLNQNGIMEKINIIDSIKTTVINITEILSKIIDGGSDLSNSSTLNSAITELRRKYNNFKNTNFNTLIAISNELSRHTTLINNLSSNSVNKDDMNEQLDAIKNSIGVIPKQIQTQNIPVTEFGNDLNNYKTPGLYCSKSKENTSNLLHVPPRAQGMGFSLVVLQHMDNSVRQLLLSSDASAAGNRTFSRNYIASSNKWSEWYELYGEHNTQTLQMHIEWSDPEGLSPTTYTLLQKTG